MTLNIFTHRPKVIEELQGKGLTFEKVEAGYSSNLALTTDGQVWTWGSGKCLGVGGGASQANSSDSETFLLPTLLEGFEGCPVLDISMGESHCLALLRDCSVYAWGLNNMGQCGLGHNAPVMVPQKVKALEGLPVHQISAGTSHSIAWTALPPNGHQTMKWQKPFCVDVSSDTFNVIGRLYFWTLFVAYYSRLFSPQQENSRVENSRYSLKLKHFLQNSSKIV